jgi:hypothetical protein
MSQLERNGSDSGRLAVPILMAAATLAAAPSARAWSPGVHEQVTGRAVDTLPKPLKQFYKTHHLEMPSVTPPAEEEEEEAAAPPAGEGPERRFAADALVPFPFADLPRSEAEVKARFPEKAAAVGRLPWLIQESYGRLVDAFKAKDKAKILAESDALASLVTDLNNPLALTENFDGQKTGQAGLWVRFSEKFPETMGKRLELSPDAARYLDDPRGYVFSMINRCYVWVDNILYADDLARRGKSGYSEIYFEALRLRAERFLKERLSAAVEDTGSYWYTAWIAAGKPELP